MSKVVKRFDIRLIRCVMKNAVPPIYESWWKPQQKRLSSISLSCWLLFFGYKCLLTDGYTYSHGKQAAVAAIAIFRQEYERETHPARQVEAVSEGTALG